MKEENDQEIPQVAKTPKEALEMRAREGSITAIQILERQKEEAEKREFRDKLLSGEI